MTTIGEHVELDLVPAGNHRRAAVVTRDQLLAAATALLGAGMRLALVSGHDDGTSMRAVYLFTSGPPDRRVELHLEIDRSSPQVPSLAGVSFPASRFEREMRDLFGIEPIAHPQPRRLVLHQHWPANWFALRHGTGHRPEMVADAGGFPFIPVKGAGVYEIPVGPVHAGLIEPGHFRFWVVGETILRMKARLWYLHKGIERLFEGRDVSSGLELAERISGDTAVGHSLAYCLAIEDALSIEIPPAARVSRSILLELERLYNHVADIGALCNDVGFALANARALGLREQLLQLNGEVTGHRLLRSGIRPGGARLQRLPGAGELSEVSEQFEDLIELATSNALVMERFTGTAVLDAAHGAELGVVGVAGRASGVGCDCRVAHPWVEAGAEFSETVRSDGDVRARFEVRVGEVRTSLALLSEMLGRAGELDSVAEIGEIVGSGEPAWRRSGVRTGLRSGEPSGLRSGVRTGLRSGEPSGLRSGVGITEAWRGAVVHRVELGPDRRLTRVKVVDPSFLNWPAVPVSLADTIVPDFPLANKSFNLSYAGNDL